MPVEAADIPQFVGLADRLRRETYGCKVWDKQGTDVIFARELVGMNFRTALELVVAHSCDPDAKTPAAIKRPFTPAPSAPKKRVGPPRKSEECPTHPGQYADNCGGCVADGLALDDDELPPLEGVVGPADVRAAMGLPPKVTP